MADYPAIKLQLMSFDLIFELGAPRLNDSDNCWMANLQPLR